MPRIVVFTPRQVRRHEDAFAQIVAESLAEVANAAALSIGGVITAAAEPAPIPPQTTPPPAPVVAPAGVTVEDLAVISGLWAEQVSAILAPQVLESFTDAAALTNELLGSAFPDWPLPEVSDSFAETYLANAVNRLQGIGDALWEAVRESLVVGFAQGESIPELSDRVRAAANVTQVRANVIARTEVISASNAGSIEQIRVAKLVGTKEWLATNDSRTRCTHRAADGQTVDLDGKFTLGGSLECGDFAVAYLDRPGDPLAPAGEIIQCRCSVAFDLDLPSEEAVEDTSEVPLVAAAQVHTGAMIALVPTEADTRALEIEGFEDADELHVTLVYLGEAASWSAEHQRLIHEIVAEVAANYEPIETKTFSVNLFNPTTDEFDTALVLGVAGKGTRLASLHHSVDLNVSDVFDDGDTLPEQHRPWIPHITLAYGDDWETLLPDALERLGPITFDRLRVAFAGEVADYPLGDDDREVLVASDFVEADHIRDTEGKFAKKPGGKVVKTLTNAVIYGKHQDGDVIATSQDGATVVKYDGKTNKIDINGTKVGKAEAYKQLKTKENWVLGGAPGGNVAPPAVTKSKPKKIGLIKNAFTAVKSGEYDGMVIAEAHSHDGKLISRYVVHGNGDDAFIVQEIAPSTPEGKWTFYKSFKTQGQWNQKLIDLKHSALTTSTIEPKEALGTADLDAPTLTSQAALGAPSVSKPTITPKAPAHAAPTSTPAAPVVTPFIKHQVKTMFKSDDVKWWTSAPDMYETAHKASTQHQITLSQVLAIMDETTKTKTSEHPFTDKIEKYLKTNKGYQHATKLITAKGVAAALGTPTPSTLPTKSYTSAPSVPTLSFIESSHSLKQNGDFKILGVAGANQLKADMDAKYGDWKPSEKAALKKYTGSYYTVMNGCLRKPPTCTPAVIKDNANASAGMRPTTRDMRVTRGAGLAALGIHVGYGQSNSPEVVAKMQALVGKTMIEPGFLSTSVTPSPAFSGAVHFEIDVPEGTKAAWVKPISHYSHENEMLLDAGLAYRIKEVLPPGNGHSNYLVRMEVVPA